MKLLSFFVSAGLLWGGEAFLPVAPHTHHSTALSAEPASRREAMNFAVTAAIVGTASLTKPAFADDAAGSIIELQVANLDGVEGQTGTIKIQLRPEWAPRGAQRFEDLTKEGFWSECRIFRVLPGFVSQFGINGDPKVQAKWRSANIPDDPVKVSNKRGTVVFATAGPNTRTSQIFFNTRNEGNGFLDKQGFSPFGEVIEGMDVVDRFYSGYGEGAPAGKGPSQAALQAKGNAYLESFPKLSYIVKGSVL